MSKELEHILVIRLSAMGDVAMTVPVIRAFTQQYPHVRLTVVTKPFFKPFFRDLPRVEVVVAEINQQHKGVFGLWKLSKQLKRLHIDAIADLHNVLRSKILKIFFFGTRVIQIDKGRAEKKALVRGQVFQQLKTTHERYADVFAQLGFPVDLNAPTFPKKSDLKQHYLDIIGSDANPWIGVAPFAAYSGKMYPIELMTLVIERLSQSHKVLLFGAGNNEATILESISKRFPNVVNLAGRLSLNEEMDVISNLDMMISMDSSNAHIAAMLGVKVISIWGVTHPYAGFMPFNHDMDMSILADRSKFPKIPTSVYGNKMPKNYEQVMESISPEQIIDKVLENL